MKNTERQKKTGVFAFAALAVVLTVMGVVLYGTGVIGTAQAFAVETTINGISVSEQTVEEAEETLQRAARDYRLTVRFAESTRSFSGEELGLIVAEGQVEQMLHLQEEAKTASSKQTLENAHLFICNGNLSELLEQLPERTACQGKTSQDAFLTYQESTGKFVIVPEVIGGTISAQALEDAVKMAAEQLQPELDLVAEGMYDRKEIRRQDDAEMTQALETANQMLKTDVTYHYDVPRTGLHGEERIHQSVLCNWLVVGEDGKTVTLSEEKLSDYVEEVARVYSVNDGTPMQFVTALDDFVETTAPAADETVDTAALKQDMIDCVSSGAQGTRNAPYRKTRSGETGTTDLGGTYAEVDLDRQYLYLYVDGERITEGDICSGNVAEGCATPAGLYTIKSKDYDRYLVGVGYQDWVHYFMPFNGGIGLHDSTWRTEAEYGGTVYLEQGSHGCINMPLELVKTVDQYLEVGDYVILYGGVS